MHSEKVSKCYTKVYLNIRADTILIAFTPLCMHYGRLEFSETDKKNLEKTSCTLHTLSSSHVSNY